MKSLIQGSFRVFDNQLNRYVEHEGFVLNRHGGLMVLRDEPNYPGFVYLCSAVASPNRFAVERWTGLMDQNGVGLFDRDLFKDGDDKVWQVFIQAYRFPKMVSGSHGDFGVYDVPFSERGESDVIPGVIIGNVHTITPNEANAMITLPPPTS